MNTRPTKQPLRPAPDLTALCFTGGPEEQYARALRILALSRDAPDSRASLEAALPELRAAQARLDACMAELRLGELCRACAGKIGPDGRPNTGGCCSAVMAENSDLPLLVLNLLLGADLRPRTEQAEACRFLGPTGCRFIVKPIFCLNYYCPRSRDHLARLGEEAERRLQADSAATLGLQTAWEARFLEAFRRLPFTP